MYKIDATGVETLQRAIKNYKGNAEKAVNEVLHEEAGPLIQESVQRLIPVSDAKKKHAKDAKSLRQINYNLAVKITTAGKYGYLYFPDDGTNTQRHIGNQQFFKQGGEAVKSDIIQRCLKRLSGDIE